MSESTCTSTTISVVLTDLDDGGLSVRSQQLPGLILSGVDREKVCNTIIPAIKALLEADGTHVIEVYPHMPWKQALAGKSPITVGLHIRKFTVVIALAA